MNFSRYPEYKESGVEWLGEVPSHWGFKPLWVLFRRDKRIGFPEEELLSVYRDYGVIPKSSRDDNFNNPSDDLGTYQLVEPGCMAINKMKAWQGSVGISEYRGIVSPAYFVFYPDHEQSPKYLHYLLRSPQYTAAYLKFSKGIRVNQWDLDPQYHSRLPVLVPRIEEQHLIAAFLDRETAKIDALVGGQEKLIDLLKEKRQAVISHAVTKGLDPTGPMKDSGIEWLGDVPEHWSVVRLKRAIMFQRGHDLPMEERQEGTIPVVSSGGVIATHNMAQAKSPGIVTGRYGTIGEFLLIQEDYWPLNTALYSIGMFENNPSFLLYMLKSIYEHFVLNSLKSAVPGVDRNDVHTVFVALAPKSEQSAIAAFLDSECSKIDVLITEAQHAIDLLKERRSALISAAVTGKIDVRGLADERDAA